MASIEESLFSRLSADATLQGYLGNPVRLTPTHVPDNEYPLPWAMYAVTSTDPVSEIDATPGLSRHEVEFDILSGSYAEARSITDRIRAILDTYRGGQVQRALWTGSTTELVDEGYHSTIGFTVWGSDAVVLTSSGATASITTTGNEVRICGTLKNCDGSADLITPELPSQTGHGGKYLTTNGTAVSWGAVSAGVTSVFGRTGVVTAATGDYTAAQVTNAASLIAANTFTVGGQVITTGAAGTKGLVVKGAASQSASLTEWANSSDVAMASVTGDGKLQFRSPLGNQQQVFSDQTNGINSLTLDTGRVFCQGDYIQAAGTGFYTNTIRAAGSALRFDFTDGSRSLQYGPWLCNGFGSAQIGFIVKGAASQSANPLEVQTSTGSTLLEALPGGGLKISDAGSTRKGVLTYYEAGGELRFGRSDTANYLGFVASYGAGGIPAFSGSNGLRMAAALGNVTICGSEAGGDHTIDLGRRLSDDNASIGTHVRIWPRSGSTANALSVLAPGGASTLMGIDKNGGLVPAGMADASAANGTLYYSTTASKLVFKDSGGTVNALY